MTRGRKILYTVGGVGLLLLFTQCMGIWIPGLEIGFWLVVGWLPFLSRVVPKLEVRWDLALSALAYAAAFTAGLHFFLRWLHREMRRTDAPVAAWRWRWTLGLVALVLVLFASGTAAVGIAHQTVWLARSPEPLYRRGSVRTKRLHCASNLRQIGRGLRDYASKHAGKYPDDLPQLVRESSVGDSNCLCPASDEDWPEVATSERLADVVTRGKISYVYFGKGFVEPVSPSTVIAVDKLENHQGDGVNVLHGNGEVRWLDKEAAEQLLLSLGFERVPAPPR